MVNYQFVITLCKCVLVVSLLSISSLCTVESKLRKEAEKMKAQFPLFEYVSKDDGMFQYEDTGYTITEQDGWSAYLLNVTSQAWLTPNDTNRYIWTHQLMVIVPTVLKYNNKAAIYVTGGDNGDSPPTNTSEDIIVGSLLAKETGSIVGVLFQVPNQPTVFSDDPTHRGRSEDAFVSFTWSEFMQHMDRPEWVDLLPMVKSVVKAMDAMQLYAEAKGWTSSLSQFMVAGASKRGWTTWLTGAADSRVMGIVPIVMDMLNFQSNLLHMWEAYHGWTFAFSDYIAINLTQKLGSNEMAALAQIIDPLVYADFLTLPKLVVDATGDEFFMPDDDAFWWGKLSGPTYRLMVQNAEHSMATGIFEALSGINAFYQGLLDDTQMPSLTWNIDSVSGNITAVTNEAPTRAIMHYANTTDGVRRDFRIARAITPSNPCNSIKINNDICFNPVLWTSQDISPVSSSAGSYTYQVSEPAPAVGWRGFFIEFHFAGNANTSYRLTTQVSIVPNTFPYQSCLSIGCPGILV